MTVEAAQDRKPGWPAVAGAAAVAAGLCVFALLIHGPPALMAAAFVALAAAGTILTLSVFRSPQPLRLLGLVPVNRRTAFYIPIGLTVGAAAAIAYRNYCGWTPLPQGLTGFAFVAALIGGTEEIVFRGYVQGRLLAGLARVRPGGATGGLSASAVVAAAALHTAYKTSLFALPPAGVATDPVFIAAWTFAGGIVFGTLRRFPATSCRRLPPMSASTCWSTPNFPPRRGGCGPDPVPFTCHGLLATRD